MGCVNPKKKAVQAMAHGGLVEGEERPSIVNRGKTHGPPKQSEEGYCICPNCGNGHRNARTHSFTRGGDM